MIYPPLNRLMENMNSRYTLVMSVAKRARALGEPDASPLVDMPKERVVTVAIEELYSGLLTVRPAPVEVLEEDE